MLAGALIGATPVLHTQIYYPQLIALAAIIGGAAVSWLLGKPDPAWSAHRARLARPRPDEEGNMTVNRSHQCPETR